MPTPSVLILFGGCSEEHDVSVRSAAEITAAVDTDRFQPVPVGITRAGEWLLCERPGPGWEDTGRPAVLSPDRAHPGLSVDGAGRSATMPVDVVFPVLHGTTGEDGAIQGLLELAGLPYVGCDVQSSAICMDKSLAYVVAASAGIPTPAFTVLHRGDALPRTLDGTVFVKPARSGSSFGVTKVERIEELDAAVEAARAYDDKVLVEEAVVGSEVGCAVLGDAPDLVLGEVDRITLSHGLFRIHQEADPERGSANATVTVPADVPERDRARVRFTAEAVYTALGCRGLARVDLFLREDGEIVLNEVNTMPGFTTYSRYPRMMAAAGIGLPEVVDRALTTALGR